MVFKVCHLNVRSLTAHFLNILDYFQTNTYDVIALSETWLTPHLSDNDVSIEGYNFLRRDRSRDARGGGVGIYLRNIYQYRLLEFNDNIEDIWVCIEYYNINVVLGCVYRSPCENVNVFLNEFETSLINNLPISNEIICFGDFNIDLLNFNSVISNKFNTILESTGLKQIIETATRVTSNSATLLDYIIIPEKCNFSVAGTVPLPQISDHELVYADLTLKLPSNQAVTRTYRDIRNVNKDILYDHLQSIPWRNIYDVDDIDGKVSFFNENINILMDIHAPFKTSTFNKFHKPWVTDNVKLIMNLRDKAEKKFKRSKNPLHFDEYKNLRNFVNICIKREKRAYLQTSLLKGSKDKWNALKKLNIVKKNKEVTKIIPENLSNVNAINQHFVNSVPAINNPGNDIYDYYNNIKDTIKVSLQFKPISVSEVCNYLVSIKTRAVGADGIHINFIILCCPFILDYICHIVNFCIINSVFPSEWKLAHVVPLPKTDSPTEYNHLRPINILAVLSKILEYAIKSQLVEHIEINNILPETQSGFRAGHSCATALLNVTDHIFKATDNGLLTVLVMLDYSKAFDTLSHELLLLILKHIGLNDGAVLFFNNYLNDRKQRVVLNGESSDFINITKGVPQGSVLGPILFSIYTASIPSYLRHCKPQMYADDVQLMCSFDSTELQTYCNLINRDLETIYKISLEHSLHLNPLKCTAMLFGRNVDRIRSAPNAKIQINGITLQLQDEVKTLGLIIDTNLRFDKHISSCIKRAISKLKLLYNSKDILNTKLKLQLSDSLVLSIFNYGDTVYGPCLTSANMQRIQKIQNYCLRFAYGIRRRQPISHKLLESKWINMKNRRKLHSGVLYHKIITYKIPSYLYRKISFRTDVHTLNIRFKGTLTPPVHKTALFQRSFSFNITRLYNSLPLHLKSRTVLSFSKNYKKHLLSHI